MGGGNFEKHRIMCILSMFNDTNVSEVFLTH